MRKNILITGLPRSGKSSLLNKVILNFPGKTGLVTNEVRENGERTGFEIETHSGKKALLASVHFDTGPKVSRYFVNTANLDYLLPEIFRFEPGKIHVDSEHGPRNISISVDKLVCDCEFYSLHGICSHVLAAEDIASTLH